MTTVAFATVARTGVFVRRDVERIHYHLHWVNILFSEGTNRKCAQVRQVCASFIASVQVLGVGTSLMVYSVS